MASVRKTGRLVVTDTAGTEFGVSAEIVATVLEREFASTKAAPVRIALPDHPCPTSQALSNHYYPRAEHIVRQVMGMMGLKAAADSVTIPLKQKLDVPDASFTGPF